MSALAARAPWPPALVISPSSPKSQSSRMSGAFWWLVRGGPTAPPSQGRACDGSTGTMYFGREVQIMLQDNTLSPLAAPAPRIPFVIWPKRFWRVLRSLCRTGRSPADVGGTLAFSRRAWKAGLQGPPRPLPTVFAP